MQLLLVLVEVVEVVAFKIKNKENIAFYLKL